MRNVSAVLYGPRDVRVEDRPVPRPAVGQVLVETAGQTGGDRVLVTRAGANGLLAGQVAKALGAEVPVLTDLSEFRLARARQLGLRTASAGLPLEEEFDVLLECSGAPSAFSSGLQTLATAGRVALDGMGADSVVLDVPLIQGRELTITGVFRYADTHPLALQLIGSGAVDVDQVITHRFALEDTEDAPTLGRRERDSLKARIRTGHDTATRPSL